MQHYERPNSFSKDLFDEIPIELLMSQGLDAVQSQSPLRSVTKIFRYRSRLCFIPFQDEKWVSFQAHETPSLDASLDVLKSTTPPLQVSKLI